MPTQAIHHEHLSVPDAHPKGPPTPLDNAACMRLIVKALAEARGKTQELLAKNGALPAETAIQKPGLTLDLSHQRISNIPLEVIELIKDEIERLVLSTVERYLLPVHQSLLSHPPLCFREMQAPPFSPGAMFLTVRRTLLFLQTRTRTQSVVNLSRRIRQSRSIAVSELALQLS